MVQVRPGGCIFRDGAVLETRSALDESPVTGESVLVARILGEMVVAALVNTATLLRVRVAAAASDNIIGCIAQMCAGHGFPCAHVALHRLITASPKIRHRSPSVARQVATRWVHAVGLLLHG